MSVCALRILSVLVLGTSLSLGAPLCGLTPSSSSSSASRSGSANPANPSGTSCLAATGSAGAGSIAASWYAGWHSADFPPSNISWSKYTNVIYSFAATTNDVGTLSLDASDAETLPTFVSLAHQNGVKASLSIGGWSGSQYYSTAVGDETNRTTFVQTVLNLVSKYNLDGIDFDWEYPNGVGIGCNTMNAMDASNFLSFLQALRAEPAGANLTLSAATSIKPWNGQDGTPLTDVSQFSKVLSFISVMNYDVWGSWSPTVGPNAPLNDTCAPPSDRDGSANALASAGALALYPHYDAASQPNGDAWDSNGAMPDACGNPGTVGGVFDFWGLIDGGFLNANGTAADGMVYTYDNCSQTPYIYNPNTQVMVSYDDATSFAAKGKFITDSGLAGFAMWETGGDSGDILLDAIRGTGIKAAGSC
ncbi:hypothetical protein EW145_g7554 [Phellinidium pouzarii]|uniref:GH18 domain-containing protein n=1 Tax=Phellinidium pouzarii TaxID=167371 RepID=A0A4S4KJA1_9AGAM|nr:hypothetical protein EW145_g7554 [Phellinidium pouzarii]